MRPPFPLIVGCALAVVLVSCASDDVLTENATTTVAVTSTATTTRAPTSTSTVEPSTESDTGLVYLTDEEGDWTLDVFFPKGEGPWPLVVMLPWTMSVDYAGRALAERGVVAVVADSWTTRAANDPAAYLDGEMNRAACVVGWAQAHATDYNANPDETTVNGYSGGAMPAAWVGLGLADDTMCDYPIASPPTGLVAGESQFLFQHSRWDETFAAGDPESLATIDGFFNADNWNVSPDLQVALWSASEPIGEIRDIENPPATDSWIWSREAGTPVVDDLAALGAFDDGRVDWSDNALLMEHRMNQAGVNVKNATYNIGHQYTDEIYDLIMSIQP